jgi:probable F420-dependent oxidoreductase
MVEVAITAEALGFDSLWLGEHVISPQLFDSKYPYHESTDDAPAFHAGLPFYDPYAALSFLAARTHTIKLAVAVSIVPLHDPYHLARSIATIDQFSDGRFILGIGAGWLREEFEIVGAPWKNRGARMEEMLELMTRLWNDPIPEYAGRFYSLPPAAMEPKPLTRPHPPFVFGGTSPIALQRAARLGDGWFGVGMDIEETESVVGTLRELLAANSRQDEPFEVTMSVAITPTADDISALANAGVDRVVVRPWIRGRDAIAGITEFAEAIDLVALVGG